MNQYSGSWNRNRQYLRLFSCGRIANVICCIFTVHTNSERHAVNQIAKFMLELIYLSSGCWYYNLYKQHTEMLPHAKHIQPYMYVLYTFVHI